jgi:2-polyprenyl-3-methyl-5-hydroxy-6-metoxy-1,4-benzoquinol methylase
MGIESEIQREYNPEHPNFERWQKARDLSADRAKFVESILSQVVTPTGLTILDLGAGEGSTSELLSKKNFVVSLEIKPERIKKINNSQSLQPLLADAFRHPFKQNIFDIIILQDVIEHIEFTEDFINELVSLLKKDGLIYLSTPNKYSLLNIISDPHWGMPLLSLFKRKQVNKYFLKHFRKKDYERSDVAELISLKEIKSKFSEKFSVSLFTKYSVEYLFNGGKGIVWSNFHLRMVKIAKALGFNKILLRIANNNPGIINKFFTPTFYVLLKKL